MTEKTTARPRKKDKEPLDGAPRSLLGRPRRKGKGSIGPTLWAAHWALHLGGTGSYEPTTTFFEMLNFKIQYFRNASFIFFK